MPDKIEDFWTLFESVFKREKRDRKEGMRKLFELLMDINKKPEKAKKK